MTPVLKAVLFDLDGTLLDTAKDFARILNAMLEDHGRSTLPFPAIRQTVSHGARALVELGFGMDEADPEFEPLRQELLKRYEQGLSHETVLFEEMDELLHFLEHQGIPWGIVTNKPEQYTRALLQDLALASRCATTICPEHVANRKPHPEAIELACREIGCEPIEALYVGDHQRDIEAGRNAGMETIAAAYGYVGDDEDIADWGADRVAESPRAVQFFIRERLGLLL